MNVADPPVATLHGPSTELAYKARSGRTPIVVFLPGFKSNMDGTKALALDGWARRQGQAMLRLDYAGHGRSGGKHIDGTISSWTEDALAVIDEVTDGPLVLVGSSMGGWIMTLIARARPQRIAGLVGLAAAPDFTQELLPNELSEAQWQALARDGAIDVASDYDDEPVTITSRLVEDGRENLVLGSPTPIDAPVRLLHGMADRDVPWAMSQRLGDALTGDDVRLTLIKSGDHRLSRPQDLDQITPWCYAIVMFRLMGVLVVFIVESRVLTP